MPTVLNVLNPISYVGTATTGGWTACPSPSTYEWSLQDISASDAGRTEDCKMHKNRIGQKVKLVLAWNNVTTATASALLTHFDPEYLYVTYLDPKAGTSVQKRFYVGDRTSPLYNTYLGLWENVSFDLIEQ